MKRRAVVAIGLLQGVLKPVFGQVSASSSLPPGAAVTRPNRPVAAFGATTSAAALAALGAGNASPGSAIGLDAPSVATERGGTTVSVSVELPGVTQVAVLVDAAATPLAALLRPDGAAQPWQVTINVDRTTRVTAAVQADGKWYSVSREIKLAAQRW